MYQQKYYKTIESHGHTWRVEIWQNIPEDEYGKPTETLTPVEIGPVLQGLRLVVQGDQADIDTPIVKTSMEMTFVDAPDLEDGRKCGYWEEFYTSSATEYMVRLYKDGVIEWTGYITPDSFSEDLRYRGSVTIIARDNLGTLQDTTCDLSYYQNADGKVGIYTVINTAMLKCACQLSLAYDSSAFPVAIGMDVDYDARAWLLEQFVDVAYLGEMNWWEALENVLGSTGTALRYVGRNTLALMPLRDIPKYGRESWGEVPIKDVTFRAYGHRELVPGVKSIREEQNFDIDTETPSETVIEMLDDTTEKTCTNIVLQGPDSTVSPKTMPVWGYRNLRGFAVTWANSSALLNVSAYPRLTGEDSEAYGVWDDESILYYGMNLTEEYPLQFRKGIFSANAKVKISLTAAKPVTVTTDGQVCNLPIDDTYTYGASITLHHRIKHEATDGTVRYYDTGTSEWTTSVKNGGISLSNMLVAVDRPSIESHELELIPPAVGVLTFEVTRISILTYGAKLRRQCKGIYLRLRDIKIDTEISGDIKMLEKLTLTTEYSDKYAIRLTRSPKFAINPTLQPEVAYVQNAILTQTKTQYGGADQWVWARKDDEKGISLVRLIHQQLLAYHAHPNNVLTGEIVTEDPTFDALYEWGGKAHLLMSGTLNILTGCMENAVLREFTRYEDMWND